MSLKVPLNKGELRGMFFRSMEKTNGHPSISPLTVLSWSRPVPSFDSGVYYPGEGRLYTVIMELFINRTEVYSIRPVNLRCGSLLFALLSSIF